MVELPLVLYNIALMHYKKKDYQQALINGLESYRIAKEFDIKSYILVDAGFISEVYKAQGNYKKANEYMSISYLGRIEYFQKDIDVRVKAMQYDFEIERTQKEISNRSKLLWLLFLSSFFIILTNVFFIVVLIRKNKRKKFLNEELNSKNRIILHHNDTLEERVAERTRQLDSINRELAIKNKELEQFTFIVSHDLQEPLLTLTNFTELIQDEYSGKLDEEGMKYIDFISGSAQRMKTLLKGLLDYSLLGKDSLIKMVDCNQIVGEVISEMTGFIAKTRADVSFQELPTVAGYEAELKLLFKSLIHNGLKFQKTSSLPLIRISATSHEKEWKFLGDKPAIIDFYADWCGPCKMVAPIMDELSKEYEGKVDIYKIDTEAEQELAAMFQIRSIPSVLFIPIAEQPRMAVGALPKNGYEQAISEIFNITK